MRRRCVALLLTAVLLPACGGVPLEGRAVQPRDGRAGLRLSGMVAGRQLALNDGAPELLAGDCDPNDGLDDDDVCIVANDIDGGLVVVVFENPSALATGASLPIADPGCRSPEVCDEVTDVAVVDVQLGVGRRRRATGGRVELTVVEPLQRYAGELRVELPDGRASGEFDVVPLPD